jgi:hypothetical protein
MKDSRLRDAEGVDAVWSALGRLCRSQPPTRVDARMEARVLQRIEAAARAPAGFGRLRPAWAALGVVLLCGTASALWHPVRHWLAPSADTVAPAPASPATRPAATPPLQPTVTAATPPPATPTASAATRPIEAVAPAGALQRSAPRPRPGGVTPHRGPRLEAPDATETPRTATATAPPANPPTGAPASSRPPPQPPQPPAPRPAAPAAPPAPRAAIDPQESALVHSAVRALRVEGKPRRARALLDEYVRRFPNGALVEDAAALAIEATAAAGDDDAARRWASRYAARFPTGRFRELADRVLREDSAKANGLAHP